MGTLNSVQERLDYLIKIKNMSENAFMKATGTNNIGKMRTEKSSTILTVNIENPHVIRKMAWGKLFYGKYLFIEFVQILGKLGNFI